ncbi:MAG: hypothetical protein JO270_12360 [Acidobacteriaceae bacterium]|nr:hypothetical protein [Acidobacteriaceae bacterium]MBV8523935.1 hypothetical protein [Acetobacteraceae bacterium]
MNERLEADRLILSAGISELNEAGGGSICAVAKPKPKLPKQAGFREFLDKEAQGPVASAREFVGRRREAQKVLRAFAERRHAGVLIHELGRLANRASLQTLRTGCLGIGRWRTGRFKPTERL